MLTPCPAMWEIPAVEETVNKQFWATNKFEVYSSSTACGTTIYFFSAYSANFFVKAFACSLFHKISPVLTLVPASVYGISYCSNKVINKLAALSYPRIPNCLSL